MPNPIVLVPERVIDAWAVASIVARSRRALIWAPAQTAQNQQQPWDLAIQGNGKARKLLIFENKGLFGRPVQRPPFSLRVPLDLPQYLFLALLEAVANLPIYYGMPSLGDADLPNPLPPEIFVARAGLRASPNPFDSWQRTPTPLALLFVPRVRVAIRKRQSVVSVPCDALTAFGNFGQLVRDTLKCRAGLLVPEEGPAGLSLPTTPDEDALYDWADELLDISEPESLDLAQESGDAREIRSGTYSAHLQQAVSSLKAHGLERAPRARLRPEAEEAAVRRKHIGRSLWTLLEVPP